MFTFCRVKLGQRVTGGKILYVNKRRHGRSSSKKSHVKRVHLLFDDDGNAVSAGTDGNTTVSEKVESFPQADEEAFQDCLETVCSDDERNLHNRNGVSEAVSSSGSFTSAVDIMDEYSSCQDETPATPAAQSGSCDEPSKNHTACDSEPVVVSKCVVTSDDPDLSKYWWQRYRLFSRFDQGIMIDRG